MVSGCRSPSPLVMSLVVNNFDMRHNKCMRKNERYPCKTKSEVCTCNSKQRYITSGKYNTFVKINEFYVLVLTCQPKWTLEWCSLKRIRWASCFYMSLRSCLHVLVFSWIAFLWGAFCFSLKLSLAGCLACKPSFFFRVSQLLRRGNSLRSSPAEFPVCASNSNHSPSDLLWDSLLIICMRSWTTSDIGGLNSRSCCIRVPKLRDIWRQTYSATKS